MLRKRMAVGLIGAGLGLAGNTAAQVDEQVTTRPAQAVELRVQGESGAVAEPLAQAQQRAEAIMRKLALKLVEPLVQVEPSRRTHLRGERQNLASLLVSVRDALDRGDTRAAVDAVGVVREIGRDDDLIALVAQLREHLQAHHEQQMTSLPRQVDQLLSEVSDGLLEASAKQLTEWRQRLSEMQRRIGNVSSEIPQRTRLTQTLTRAVNVVEQWAQVRSYLDAQRPLDALGAMTYVAENGETPWLDQKAIRAFAQSLRQSSLTELRKKLDERLMALLSAGSAPDAATPASELRDELQRIGNSAAAPFMGETFQLRQLADQWVASLEAEAQGRYREALRNIEQWRINARQDLPQEASKAIADRVERLRAAINSEAVNPAEPALRDLLALIDKADTPEQMQAAYERVQAELSHRNFDNQTVLRELQTWLADVAGVVSMHRMLQARRFDQFWSRYAGRESGDGRSSGLPTRHRWEDQTIAMRAAAARTALIEGGLARPADLPTDPPLDRSLLALADQAFGEQDWQRLAMALDGYRMVSYPNGAAPAWLEAELGAARAMVVAAQNEQGGLLREAAERYRYVLDRVAPRVPVAQAGRRLSTITEQLSRQASTQPTAAPATLPAAPGQH